MSEKGMEHFEESEYAHRFREIRQAWRSKEAALAAVTEWVRAEGFQGHLVTNAQAPGWPEYRKCEAELTAVFEKAMR